MNKLFILITRIFLGGGLALCFLYVVLLSYIYYSDTRDVKIVTNVKSIYSRIKEPHQLELLKHGIDSLIKRIDMIKSAKESIELEFFIYELDEASTLVTQELIKASKRGVKIKLLVDYSVAVFKLAPKYAGELMESGIEVRYYNTAANSNLIAVQHRNHRKLLIVDGVSAVTGGRNIATEYFDLNESYNFLDYDVVVNGKIVRDIRQSFFHYWESDYASIPDKDINGESYFSNKSIDKKILNKIVAARLSYNERKETSECRDIAFTTDFPGVLVNNRQVYKRLEELVQSATEELIAESPYLILRKDGAELIKSVTSRGVSFSILTNGLHSTDAYYTSAAMGLSLGVMEDIDLTLYLFEGKSIYSQETVGDRWGIHSKRAVVDKKHTVIGTYNIDPRSANLNSEMIIICRDNPELASIILDDINERINGSIKLGVDDYNLSAITKDAGRSSVIKFYLSLPLVFFLEFLL